jgi:hypothetical protein
MLGYAPGNAPDQLYLADPAVKTTLPAPVPPADIEIRFKYNQDFESIYAMVPSSISLLLALFPAISMALAIVREKELGSITNLYVTPVTRIEFLLGKQLPYVAVARCPARVHRQMVRHGLAGAADVTSWVTTLKLASVHGPNEVTIATSVASRPRAIRMRPMRGLLWRASNVYQRSPR